MTSHDVGISDSRFHMWRAVISMVHADGVVTPHEMAFVQESIKDINLSPSQLEIIGQDLKIAQDSYEMFTRITNPDDKKDFFSLARAVSWCDGDLDKQEKLILKNLEKIHMNKEEVDMLTQSRDVISEIQLCQNQWNMKGGDNSNSSMFGFFKRFATA